MFYSNMFYNLMILTTYIFDLFIKIVFLDGIMGKSKRRLHLIPYTLIMLTVEVVPYIIGTSVVVVYQNFTFPGELMVSLISTVLFLLATLLYDAVWPLRLFATTFFFVFILVDASLFITLQEYANPWTLTRGGNYLACYIDFGSKLTLFLLTLIITTFRKMRDERHKVLIYNILLFTVPVFTLVLMVAMPLMNILYVGNQTNNTSFLFLLFSSVAFMNITVYLLIEKIKNINELEHDYRSMEQQMKFQREKYVQLGSYYKSMRSIIHDMKNHYFSITNYIENKEYDKLQDYMKDAIRKMENCYAGVNTGSLVIDAFMNHFKMLSENEHIAFSEDISIAPDKVPLTDYDLCVVIGNLLDNAYNAVSQVTDKEKTVSIHISVNDSDSFVIFVKNTYDANGGNDRTKDDFEHGYGLSNIEKIVNTYHGVMQYKADEYFVVTIVIPVIGTAVAPVSPLASS